jgi:hypothetical protein
MANATKATNATNSGIIHLLSHLHIFVFWLLEVIRLRMQLGPSDSLISHRKYPSSQGPQTRKGRGELLGVVLSCGIDVAAGDDVARREI